MNMENYLNDYEDLILFSKQVKSRLKDDWDIVIALGGEEGIGKSTLEIELGFLIDDNGFDLKENIAYIPDEKEITKKFKELPFLSVFGIDEAAKSLYKLRWMDKLQVAINQMYQTERWQNKATILCMPRFTDLNEYFRNHRVKIWIEVIERGFAVAFIRDDVNIFAKDPWHLRKNARTVSKMRFKKRKRLTEFTKEERHYLYKESTNFFFAFDFPQLPEEVEEEFRKLRAESRGKELDPDVKLMKKVAFELSERGITQREIGDILDRAQPTVNQYIMDYKDFITDRN